MSFFLLFFIYFRFLKQRLDRVLKKIKNKQVIAITEKSRVNKKIRRIFNNKKRVNVKFLKYVFSLFVSRFFFLTKLFRFRARINRFNIIYKRFKTREFLFIFEKKVTLKLLNALKIKFFTTVERVIKIEVFFEFLFLRALLFSSEISDEEFLKLKFFSS